MARKRYVKNPALDKSPIIEAMPAACADEAAAQAFWENMRWGGCPACPRCGDTAVYRMTGETATRRGLWRCKGCKRQFTVRIGTVLEESPMPLRTWARILWEMASCKHGVSALEISRKVQITHKSALFALNRLRWAMADGPETPPRLTGTVEVDEAFIGPVQKWRNAESRRRQPDPRDKPVLFAIVQRDGVARSMVIPRINAGNMQAIMRENIDPSARLMTDGGRTYPGLDRSNHPHHGVVRHTCGEYVVPGTDIHTNTVEGYFSRVRRSLHGVYHSVSREHFHRYTAQWDFAQSTRKLTDGERVQLLARKMDGKRLVYKDARRIA